MKLNFEKLIYKNVFNTDWKENSHSIELKEIYNNGGGLAIVYAPNGIGKSSLTHALESSESNDKIDFNIEYSDDKIKKHLTPQTKSFFVINDQISRNIIGGSTADYLIGKNIKDLYELTEKLNKHFVEGYESIISKLKDEYNLTKKTSKFIDLIKSKNVSCDLFLSSLVNNKDKGKSIDRSKLICFINKNKDSFFKKELDCNQKNFVLNQIDIKDGVLNTFESIKFENISKNESLDIYEQNSDALKILHKYEKLDACIVCDNNSFDSKNLIKKKEDSKRNIENNLTTELKLILEKIIKSDILQYDDPFEIKESIRILLNNGDLSKIIKVREKINEVKSNICNNIIFDLVHIFDNTETINLFYKWQNLKNEEPEISDDELLYIKNVISDNIEKKIEIEKEENILKLTLDGNEFLGKERKELSLSSGEQNFISLSFELLRAKNSDKEFVIIDDPISSFDSIYKNKIAYCLLEFLREKKTIIFTHNLELIKLLNCQYRGGYNLYFLGNSEIGRNGFIPVKDKEKDILIDLHCLIETFSTNKNGLKEKIKDEKLFLLSMIPFLRGFSHILPGKEKIYNELSNIMHGYESSEFKLDINNVYKNLFNYTFFDEPCVVSVDDILKLDINEVGKSNIVDDDSLSLLSSTLKQNLIYFYLRMLVEKQLVDYCIKQEKSKKGLDTLHAIIRTAFPENSEIEEVDKVNRRFRVFFTSRRTLLNEFNHFEGNMNIFQPAIDISEESLQKEAEDIISKLNELNSKKH